MFLCAVKESHTKTQLVNVDTSHKTCQTMTSWSTKQSIFLPLNKSKDGPDSKGCEMILICPHTNIFFSPNKIHQGIHGGKGPLLFIQIVHSVAKSRLDYQPQYQSYNTQCKAKCKKQQLNSCCSCFNIVLRLLTAGQWQVLR